MMTYPTVEEVEQAGQKKIVDWYQHLPVPSDEVQQEVMSKVIERYILIDPQVVSKMAAYKNGGISRASARVSRRV